MTKKLHILSAAAVAGLLAFPACAQQSAGGHTGHSAAGASQTPQVSGTGTVEAVDPAKHTVNLKHDAIPAIGWPAMSMGFAVHSTVDLSTVKSGQAVEFTLVPAGGGNYTIASMKPKG